MSADKSADGLNVAIHGKGFAGFVRVLAILVKNETLFPFRVVSSTLIDAYAPPEVIPAQGKTMKVIVVVQEDSPAP